MHCHNRCSRIDSTASYLCYCCSNCSCCSTTNWTSSCIRPRYSPYHNHGQLSRPDKRLRVLYSLTMDHWIHCNIPSTPNWSATTDQIHDGHCSCCHAPCDGDCVVYHDPVHHYCYYCGWANATSVSDQNSLSCRRRSHSGDCCAPGTSRDLVAVASEVRSTHHNCHIGVVVVAVGRVDIVSVGIHW